MKKNVIITSILVVVTAIFFVVCYLGGPFSSKNNELDPFAIEGDLVVGQKKFLSQRDIVLPIKTNRKALSVVIAATDILARIVAYNKTRVAYLHWEAVVKRQSETQWLVIFREKGPKAMYACWSTLNNITHEPTPLKCISKKR